MESTIPIEILDRYSDILKRQNASLAIDPDGRHLGHLLWMLEEIRTCSVTNDKAHRWLGYIQGRMVSVNLISVMEERDFTRSFFTKSEIT